jgi:hypothetical protein
MIDVASGPAFALFDGMQQTAPNEHNRSFGFLRAGPPSSGGDLHASVGTYSVSIQYTQGRPAASHVNAVARTSELYIDRASVRVGYSLTDAFGEPRVEQSGLYVSLGLAFTDGTPVLEEACALPDALTGVGECEQTLPSSMFGSVARPAQVAVVVQYGGNMVATASAGAVTLMGTIAHVGLSAAGMLATLPQSPRFVEDEFDVTIHAHTGASAFALKGWSFLIQYDVGVLSLISSSFSSVYQTPTTALDSGAGTFDAVTTGLDPSASNGDVQGRTSLYLATLRFRVVGGEGQSASSALSGTVGSMVNQGTQRYVSNAAMLLTDYRAGQHTAGAVAVEQLAVVGVLAYWGATLGSSSFVNTAALSGVASSASVRVIELHNRPALNSRERTSAYSCTSRDPSMAEVASSTCVASAGSAQSTGGRTTVDVYRAASGALVAELPVAVWYPQSVAVELADAQLESVNCTSSSSFQETVVSARATFGGTGLLSVDGVDVSSLVGFVSSNEAVATISSRTVRGAAVGSALVRATVASSTLVPSAATLTVTAATVTLTSIRAVVVNSIGWSNAPPHVPWSSADAGFSASAVVGQSLSSEGDVGDVLAYAVFSDGAEQPLRASELTVTPTSPSVNASFTGAAWRMEVSVGAMRECGRLLMVEWGACGFGYARVHLRMPNAIAIRASIGAPRLTPPGDGATLPPMAVATSAEVVVEVDFDDGSTRDFSLDARTAFSVPSAYAACVEVRGVRTLAMLSGAACAQVGITASVPSVAPGLEATATVPVARFVALEVWAVPYPSYTGYESMRMSRPLRGPNAHLHTR